MMMSASEAAAAAAAATTWTTTACDGISTASALLDNASTQYPSSSSSDQSDKIANAIWIYMGPVIFFVGLVGNILILTVMSMKRMRGTSTSDYLLIMAAADLLTILIGMIPEWLEAMGIFTLQESHPAACKIYKFLSYSFGDMAIWIRVLFTLDRFMAICFPMKKTDCCLPQRAKFYCLGAALAAFAKNMNEFWTRGAEYETVPVFETVDCVAGMPTNRTVTRLASNCGYPKPEYEHFEIYVRPWIVFALVNLIPFFVILICNIFIVRAMIQMKRRRLQRHLSTTKGGGERHLLQTTAMCLAASFTFLVCVTPTMVLLIGKPYWTSDGPNVAYDIAKSVSNQLQYVNNSANFFLYCITGQKFRQTLVLVLRCSCCSKDEEAMRRSKRESSSGGAGRISTVRPGDRVPTTNHPSSGGSITDVTTSTHPPLPPPDRNSSSSSSSSSADVTCHVTSSIASSPEDAVAVILEDDGDDDSVGRQREMEENERTFEDTQVFAGIQLSIVDENKTDTDATFDERWLPESESSSGISSSGSKDTSPEVAETPQPQATEPVIRTLEDDGYSHQEEIHPHLHSDDAFERKNSNSEISENSIELSASMYSPNSSASLDLMNGESVNQRKSDSSSESQNHAFPCRRKSLETKDLVVKIDETSNVTPAVQPPISAQPLSKASHSPDRIFQLSVEPSIDEAETFSELGDSNTDSDPLSYTNLGFAHDNEVETEQQISDSAAKGKLNWNILTDNPDYSNC